MAALVQKAAKTARNLKEGLQKDRQSGFTLFEVLVAVLLLGMVAGMVTLFCM